MKTFGKYSDSTTEVAKFSIDNRLSRPLLQGWTSDLRSFKVLRQTGPTQGGRPIQQLDAAIKAKCLVRSATEATASHLYWATNYAVDKVAHHVWLN